MPETQVVNLACMGELEHDWPFIYFHGNAEGVVNQNKSSEQAPDLVSADVSVAEVEDGEHTVFVYGFQAILFLWTDGTRNMVTGLVQPPPTRQLGCRRARAGRHPEEPSMQISITYCAR